jgi:uncharacterized membrane protein
MSAALFGFIGLVLGIALFSDSGVGWFAGGALGAVIGATLGLVLGALRQQKELTAALKQLRSELQALRSASSPPPAAAAAAAPLTAPPPPELPPTYAREPAGAASERPWPAAAAPPPVPALAPDALEQFLGRVFDLARGWIFGGNPLLRVGSVVLFLGLAFALRLAAQFDVIPVGLWYAGVALSGFVILAIGWRVRKRRRTYGLLMQGLGVAVLYLTISAAMHLNPLLAPVPGFALLVIVVLCAATLAVMQDSLALAAMGAAGGFAAPILTATGGEHHVELFSYYAALNAGILAIAWFKAWRPLNVVGFAATLVIGFAWGIAGYQPSMFWTTEPFLLLFFLMYVAIAFLFARRMLADAKTAPPAEDRLAVMIWAARQSSYLDGTLLFGTPIIGFGLQYALVEPIEYGAALSALGLGLFYMLLAFVLLRRAHPRYVALVEIYVALGALFATLALPLGLGARWTSAAWAVEGAGVYWIGITQKRRLTRGFALLVQLGAGIAYLASLGEGDAAILSGSRLGALMLGASLLFSYRQLRGVAAAERRIEDKGAIIALAAGGLASLYLLAPLFFRENGTAVGWALAGLATLYAGLRLADRNWMIAALAIEALGGAAFLFGAYPALEPLTLRPLWHAGFWTPLLIALAAYVGAWLVFRSEQRQAALKPPLDAGAVSVGLLIWAAAWWGFAWLSEAVRFLSEDSRPHAMLLVTALTIMLWMMAAEFWQWRALAAFCALSIPEALLALIMVVEPYYHPAAHLGAVAWPALLAAHLLVLRRIPDLLPEKSPSLLHILGCWIFLGVAALEVRYAFIADDFNAWCWLGWAAVPAAYLLAMSAKRFPAFWPFTAYEREYRAIAALPVAAILLAWFWLGNIISDGTAAPLPYIPLLNPLELGQIVALFALLSWQRARFPMLPWAAAVPAAAPYWLVGASALFLLTCGAARLAHHWFGVAYAFEPLFASMLVQASLSIIWGVAALAVMIAGHLRQERDLWIIGATLMAVVVVKLFLVELFHAGGVPQAVSFVGVGVLLLIIGYFAPLPPKRAPKLEEMAG